MKLGVLREDEIKLINLNLQGNFSLIGEIQLAEIDDTQKIEKDFRKVQQP